MASKRLMVSLHTFDQLVNNVMGKIKKCMLILYPGLPEKKDIDVKLCMFQQESESESPIYLHENPGMETAFVISSCSLLE
jgi:hypothetical protein